MSLPAMRLAVARLLTDPAYQARFFAAPEDDAPLFGLAREEFAALRGLDRRKLAITSEGFLGKRLEHLREEFPVTLAAMTALDPDAGRRYLSSTSYPATPDAERASLLAYLTHAEWPEAARPLLLDLHDAELALLRAPRPHGTPQYRLRPETRPRRAPYVPAVSLRGPLGARTLSAPAPTEYPARPGRALVLRRPGGLEAVDLTPRDEALLAACDGRRTLRDLAESFGPEAEATLAAWLRLRVVEDDESKAR